MNRALLTLSALTVLASPALAAVSSAGPISKIAMSAQKGGAAQTAFTPDTPVFFLSCRVAGEKGTPVRADWIAEKVEADVAPNYRIDSAQIKLPVTSRGLLHNTLTFDLARSSEVWPKGKYRVDLYVAKNGAFPAKPETSVRFEVR